MRTFACVLASLRHGAKVWSVIVPFVGQNHLLLCPEAVCKIKRKHHRGHKTSLMEYIKKGKRSKKICMTNEVSAFNLDYCAL